VPALAPLMCAWEARMPADAPLSVETTAAKAMLDF
jgi:hypothetical protein